MSASPEKRIRQWDRKYSVGRAMAAIEAQRPKMLERYEAVITALCNVEQMTREVLNERSARRSAPGIRGFAPDSPARV